MTQTLENSITVQEALRQIKLTESKLQRNMQVPAIAVKLPGTSTVGGSATEEEFVQRSKANYQSTADLIRNYHLMKQRVALSNAQTYVTIAGRRMTVVAAIEYKTSIRKETALLLRLRTELAAAMTTFTREQQKVQLAAEQAAMSYFANNPSVATNGIIDKSTEQYTSFITTYVKDNAPKLVDPNNLQQEVDELEKFIEEFEAEVDNVLTISNVKTIISLAPEALHTPAPLNQ